MEIGVSLRKLREAKGMSIQALAEEIGIGQSTYADWENGRTSPSLEGFLRLSEAISVDPSNLLSYLLGHLNVEQLLENKMKIEDLQEMIRFYEGYTGILKMNKSVLEEEVKKLKGFLKDLSNM